MNVYDWIKSRDCRVENLIITDNIKNINAIIRRVNGKGIVTGNIVSKTIMETAKEVVFQDFAKNGKLTGIEFVSNDIGTFILEEIIRKNADFYRFVPLSSMCQRTASEILGNINLIRENKLRDNLVIEAGDKIEQLMHLVSEYEKALEEKNLYDRIRCIKDAIRIMKASKEEHAVSCCGLLYDKEHSSLEREFLALYVKNIEVLSLEFGESRAKWNFFKGYGTYNEVDYVISDIINKGIPFGKVNIIYTSGEYETIIAGICALRGIPVRFITGISAGGLDYMRVIHTILSWAESDYSYEQLKPLFLNKLVTLKTGEGEKEYRIDTIKEFIRGIEAGIGWGLDRYEKYINKYRSRTEEENKHAPRKEFIDVLDRLAKTFQEIEDMGKGGEISLAEMLSRIVWIADSITGKRNREKQFIKGALREEIKSLKYKSTAKSLPEAIKVLKEDLEKIGICDDESADAVSVMVASGKIILERPYVYVIGLSDRQYKQSVNESPVLSDEDRMRCFDMEKGNVVLAGNRHIRRQEDFFATLMSLESGEVHIGYSGFDTIELEPCSPSALYLNLMDEMNVEKDDITVTEYSDVLEDKVIVKTENDDPNEADIDDIKEVTVRISASTLDSLVNCPLWYHYCHERKIPSEEYQEPVIGRWLNPAEKGSFVHKVLQDYVTKFFMNVPVKAGLIDADFDAVFESVKNEFEAICPIDSKAVARKETEEIYYALRDYLKMLHKEFASVGSKWKVEACELFFGPDSNHSLNKSYVFDDDETLNVNYSGCIDRLDSYTDLFGKKHYRIVDYKTSDLDKFIQYKLDVTTQHHIYAMFGLESGIVDEFVYAFPLEEGNKVITIKDFMDPCTDMPDISEKLYQVFFAHDFEEKPNGVNCKYCNYLDICYHNTL